MVDGPRAMLATLMSPTDFAMISEPSFAMERKIDGHRKLVQTGPSGAKAFNRSGSPTTLPSALLSALDALETPAVLDGELYQGRLHLFDLPFYDGVIDQSTPWARRHMALRKLLDLWSPVGFLFEVVPFVRDSGDKMALLSEIQDSGGEGVVAKRIDSPYTPGYSTAWLKLKLLEDVDVVVVEQSSDGKRNLTLAMADPSGDLLLPGGVRGRNVGRCSAITGDGPRVQVGDVVTVRVGGVGSSGRLVEPRTPRLRDDKTPADCTIDQLVPVRKISR